MRSVKAISVTCILFLLLAGCAAGPANGSNSESALSLASAEPLSTHVLTDSGNPVLELIAASYSASAFAEGEVPKSDIERILTSGAKAPSAKNAQPWHFTVIKNHEINTRLLSQAKDGNIIVVISGKRDITTDTMQFDCGLATQNMQLAAESLGLGARIFIEPVQKIEDQRSTLGIPEDYDVLAALLIGFVDNAVDAVTSATPRDALLNHINYVQ